MKIKEIKSKASKHIKENKAVYIGTITGLVIGAFGAVLLIKKGNKTVLCGVGDQAAANIVQADKIHHLYQRISIYGNVIGRHGNPVREVDVVTGKTLHEYATQGLAALHAGVTEHSMSRHLDGKYMDLNGRTFERMSLDWIQNPA